MDFCGFSAMEKGIKHDTGSLFKPLKTHKRAPFSSFLWLEIVQCAYRSRGSCCFKCFILHSKSDNMVKNNQVSNKISKMLSS